jgi:predicted TIM-barrel fold metal-dependent hydrolase
MIIDFHTHLFPPNAFRPEAAEPLARMGLWNELGDRLLKGGFTPEELIAYYRSQGVDRTVVLAEVTPTTTGVSSNEFVGEFCAGHPELIPFASLNPFVEGDLVARLDELLARWPFRGIKVHPSYMHIHANDARWYPLYARCQELGLVVLVHTGISYFPGNRLKYASPIDLDDVAADFPRLPVVMAHAGRNLWFDEAFMLAQLRPNIYLEVAGLPPQNLLDYFPKLHRAIDKVIFGSDFPGAPGGVAENIAAIRALPLPDGAADKILGGNALELLGQV